MGVCLFKKGLKVNPTLTQFPRDRVMQFGGSNSTITYIIEVDQLVSLSRVIEPGVVLLSEGLPDWFVLRIQSHVGLVWTWSKSKMRWQKKLVVYFFARRWLGARSSKERKVRKEKQRSGSWRPSWEYFWEQVQQKLSLTQGSRPTP